MNIIYKLLFSASATGSCAYGWIDSIAEGNYFYAATLGLLQIGSACLTIKYGRALEKQINGLEQSIQDYAPSE